MHSQGLPRSLSIASRLWAAAGVLVLVLIAAAVWRGLGDAQYSILAVALVGLIFAGIGSGLVSLGRGLRRGQDNRIALIVLGVFTVPLVFPPLLILLAIILQYTNASRAWLSSQRPPNRPS